MESIICFPQFLCVTNLALATRMVSLPSNMTRCLTLRRIISWSAVAVYFEPGLNPIIRISDFDWFMMCLSILSCQSTFTQVNTD